MRYALAALLILFMSSCQTVTHSECVDAKKVLEAARDKVNAVTDADMRLFRLSERERKAFLSNLNSIPPITNHNWPFIYGLVSKKRPNVFLMTADKDGCVVGTQQIPEPAFRRLLTDNSL